MPALLALAALIVAWLVTQDVEAGLLRAGIVLGFLLIGPGAAFVPLLRLEDPAYTVILSVALSLTLNLLVAAVAVYAGFWSPPLIVNILVGLTFIGVLLQIVPGIGGFDQAAPPDDESSEPMLASSLDPQE